jgi:hypothetical protein
VSLPGEYDSWRCDECLKGKTCRAIYHPCDTCNDEDEDCGSCSGQGGSHVCEHAEEGDTP